MDPIFGMDKRVKLCYTVMSIKTDKQSDATSRRCRIAYQSE